MRAEGVTVRRIDAARAKDANLPNEPFQSAGRLVPSLTDGVWSCTVRLSGDIPEELFPDVPYDPAADDAVFLGAYEGDDCVGVAVLRRDMFRYLYLDDLKVRADRRRRGVGGSLIDACMEEARGMGLLGVYAVCQDNNLSACLFYLKQGFEIGGFDNRSYRGTAQAAKANLFFYKDL